MWILFSCISIFLYSLCEIYEKKGSSFEESNSEAKLLVWFGLFGLLIACFVSINGLRETDTGFFEMAIENPALILSTVFYFLSLLFAFMSLKLIPVSIEAPITNISGSISFVGAIILFIILGKYQKVIEEITSIKLLLVLIIFLVVLLFSYLYHKRIENDEDINEYKKNKMIGNKRKALFYATVGILLAVLSSICDAGNSVVSYYVLNEIAESNDYIYFSNLLFFLLGCLAWIIVSFKEKKIYNPFSKNQHIKAIGAGFDCLGMVTNVLAVDANPFFADPIISTYFIFTIILSQILLKEKLNKKQYLCAFVLVICICLFAILDR